MYWIFSDYLFLSLVSDTKMNQLKLFEDNVFNLKVWMFIVSPSISPIMMFPMFGIDA